MSSVVETADVGLPLPASSSSHVKSAQVEACAPRAQQLRSYGGDIARAQVYTPTSLEQLRSVLAEARSHERRVTFRGGGCAFDSQSLGNDVVISLAAFADIHVDPERMTVSAGPGAKWGAVLAAAQQHGLIPRSLVTTADATVGGTASADCLSRFSPVCGKEGAQIESFDLLSVSGELFHCSRTHHRELFFGAIGGFGYLGAITRITYRLARVGKSPRVETEVTPYASVRALITALAEDVVAHDAEVDASAMQARYGAWFGQRALGFRGRYVDEKTKIRPLPFLHQPYSFMRIVTDIILRNPWIGYVMSWISFHVVGQKTRRYVDGLEDYAFFMDGNARAKRFGHKFGAPMRSLQQTFVIPAELPAPDDAAFARGVDDATRFIEELSSDIRAHGLLPALFDALFIPKDEDFLLSSSRGSGGFAVSLAFETSNPRMLAAARAIMIAAAKRCRAAGGRVHLVKHVVADTEDLRAMYGAGAEAFFALKRRMDPDGMLRNEFLERVFGPLSGWKRAD